MADFKRIDEIVVKIIEDFKNLHTELSSEEQKEPAKKEEVKTLSLADVRGVLAELTRSGMTSEVRSLLKKYGANKLSEVDPQCYESLLADAKELANNARNS